MKRLSISLAALLAASPALGQTTDVELDEIVVTANRTETEASRTGASVTVVTEDQLKAAKPQALGSYLSSLPGVFTVTSGGFGTQSDISIRGASARYVTVLVDGIRVDDPTGIATSFDFGSLLTSDVGRVEIVRGSQSALYGSAAVGGIMSITTLGATEDGTRQTVEVEAGSYGTARLSYSLTQKTDRLETALNFTRFHTDGFSAVAAGTEPDGADATRLSLSAKYRMTDTLALGFTAFRQVTSQDYDDGFGFTDGIGWRQDRRETGLRLFAELDMGRTQHVFDLSRYDVFRQYLDPFGGTFDGQRTSLSWKATTSATDALTFVYGTDTAQDSVANLGTTADSRLTGLYAQALWAPSDSFDGSLALRIDDSSDFGTFTSGRIAGNWRSGNGLTIKGALARGFLAPSVYQRFGDTIFGIAPNAALQPETSLSAELGAELELAGGATVAATVFALNIDNAINYCGAFATACTSAIIAAPFTNAYENVAGTSHRRGVELEFSAPVANGWTLTGNYTFTNATLPSGTRFSGVPRNKVSLGLAGDLSDRLSADVTMTAVSGLMDGATELASFVKADATLTYAINDATAAYIRIENIGDATYQTNAGYANSGRALYAGLRASF